MKTTLSIALSLILLAGVFTPLYANAAPPEVPAPKKQFAITGAGATFVFPLIDMWRVEYNKVYPNVQLNYQSIGSGGGIKQHTSKLVQFGASDAPLTVKERLKAKGTLQIPETIGAVTVVYNVPEIPESGLKLTGQNIVDIYMGMLKKWNDPRIAANNPDLDLPNKPILVTRRSDGSGTTYVFTDYLSKISGDWKLKVGIGKSVPWPVGVGAAGNEGVATAVKKTKYAIGYVELAYATQNEMTFAAVQNADGSNFVLPSLESAAAAAAGAVSGLPKAQDDWAKVSITNQKGANAYPITTFSYLLVYTAIDNVVKDMNEAKAVVHLIHWMLTDGQQFADDLLYVPIPPATVEIGKEALGSITYKGEKVWTGYEPPAAPAKSTVNDEKMSDKKTTEKKEVKTTKPKPTSSANPKTTSSK